MSGRDSRVGRPYPVRAGPTKNSGDQDCRVCSWWQYFITSRLGLEWTVLESRAAPSAGPLRRHSGLRSSMLRRTMRTTKPGASRYRVAFIVCSAFAVLALTLHLWSIPLGGQVRTLSDKWRTSRDPNDYVDPAPGAHDYLQGAKPPARVPVDYHSNLTYQAEVRLGGGPQPACQGWGRFLGRRVAGPGPREASLAGQARAMLSPGAESSAVRCSSQAARSNVGPATLHHAARARVGPSQSPGWRAGPGVVCSGLGPHPRRPGISPRPRTHSLSQLCAPREPTWTQAPPNPRTHRSWRRGRRSTRSSSRPTWRRGSSLASRRSCWGTRRPWAPCVRAPMPASRSPGAVSGSSTASNPPSARPPQRVRRW